MGGMSASFVAHTKLTNCYCYCYVRYVAQADDGLCHPAHTSNCTSYGCCSCKCTNTIQELSPILYMDFEHSHQMNSTCTAVHKRLT